MKQSSFTSRGQAVNGINAIMKLISPVIPCRDGDCTRAGSPRSRANGAKRWLVIPVWMLLVAGCSTPNMIVDKVWQDSARASAPLGKTLVVAFFPNTDLAMPIENEWVRQLGERGMKAEAFHQLLPEKGAPDKQTILEVVRAKGFHTVLVSELINVKKVGRDVSSSEVAVVEVKLYDTGTEQLFWSVRSDSYIQSVTAGGEARLRATLIRGFVERIIQEMPRSHFEATDNGQPDAVGLAAFE